jgi:hypothetical protein
MMRTDLIRTHELEKDIWCEIFAFLPPQDLIQAIQVCTTWKRWCFENRIWKHLLFSSQMYDQDYMLVELKNRRTREGVYFHDDEDEEESWERQVRQDNVSSCMYALVQASNQTPHNNTHVNLRQNRSLTDSAFLHLLKIRSEKKRKTRKRNNLQPNEELPQVRTIEHLILDWCEYLTDKSLLRLVKLHKRNSQILSLRHLSVARCRFTTQGLHQILSIGGVRGLEHLNLSYNQYILSHLFTDDIQLNSLVTLDLSGYPYTLEHQDVEIIHKLASLRNLYLNECLMIGIEQVNMLTSGVSSNRLETLEIGYNPYLTHSYFVQQYLTHHHHHGHHHHHPLYQCLNEYITRCKHLVHLNLSGLRLHRSFFYFGNLIENLTQLESFKMNHCDIAPTPSFRAKCKCSEGYLILPEHTVHVASKWTKLDTLELELDDQHHYDDRNDAIVLHYQPMLHPKCIEHFLACPALRNFKLGRSKRPVQQPFAQKGAPTLTSKAVCMTCSVSDLPALANAQDGCKHLQQFSMCLLDAPWNNLKFVKQMASRCANLTYLNLCVTRLPRTRRRNLHAPRREEEDFMWDVIEAFLEACGKLVKISLYPIHKEDRSE